MELHDFLLARIAEDEELARSVQQRHAYLEPYAPAVPGLGLEWDDHMVYAPPFRVLAECDAKRQIVKMHGPTKEPPGGFVYPEAASMCRACGPGDSWRSRNEPDSAVPCATLRFLALPYADHSDYRAAWRA